MAPPTVDVHGLVKPLLRGRLHLGALFVAVPAVIVLIVIARGATATMSAAVYGTTLVALFAISSAYHRFDPQSRWCRVLRRLDHAMIYLLIAGSYTPFAAVAIGGKLGVALIATVWSLALLGVALKLRWFDRTHGVGSALYIGIGWLAIVAAPAMIHRVSGISLTLLVLGGIAYTGGAIILGTRRPDPFPRVFGYHEVWHALTIAAAALHYVAIASVVRGA
jgi:hemolysin III